MTLREEFVDLAVQLINDPDFDLDTLTVEQRTTGVFDPMTGNTNDTITSASLAGFFDPEFNGQENLDDLNTGESLVIFAGQDLINAGVDPQVNDTIVDARGANWIINAESGTDTYGAARVFNVRRSNSG